MKELIKIQSELKAPKSLYNSFGRYAYRSAETILEALKPHLLENECILILSDEIVLIGDRYYIKATATLTNKYNKSVANTAYAREGAKFKKMGTRAGFPDLLLLLPSHDRRHHALGIELKTPTGQLSDNQKAWARVAMGYGVKYVVCRSFDEFKNEVLTYLNVKMR